MDESEKDAENMKKMEHTNDGYWGIMCYVSQISQKPQKFLIHIEKLERHERLFT